MSSSPPNGNRPPSRRKRSFASTSQERTVRPRLTQEDEDDYWYNHFLTHAASTSTLLEDSSWNKFLPATVQEEWKGKIENLTDLIELGKAFDPEEPNKYYFPHYRIHRLVEPLDELNAMVGMDQLKKSLLSHMLFYCQDIEPKQAAMMHTVIEGPPGSGKTHLAHILAKIYCRMGYLETEKVHAVRRSDLIAQYLGQTAVKTQKAIDDAQGGVLLIDEAYSLGNPEGRDSYSKECIDTLNQNLSENKKNFICIVIGYKDALKDCFFKYNPGLERRFPFRYTMDEYSPEQLWLIEKKLLKDQTWEVKQELHTRCEEFFKEKRDYFMFNGGDLEVFMQCMKLAHGKRVFGLHPDNYRKLDWNDWEAGFKLFLENDEVAKRGKDSMDIVWKNMYC